jgi:uncharacterized membrane protein HdeD (DUF308 family)
MIGVMVLAWPGPPILIASTLFGVYLLISGLAELIVAFTMHLSAATRVMLFMSGATSLVLAILALRLYGNGYAVPLLALWLGIGVLLQGISGVAAGIGVRNLTDRGWYIVSGIVSVIAGIVVLVWPFDSIAAHPGRRHLAARHRHLPDHARIPNPQGGQHGAPVPRWPSRISGSAVGQRHFGL